MPVKFKCSIVKLEKLNQKSFQSFEDETSNNLKSAKNSEVGCKR